MVPSIAVLGNDVGLTGDEPRSGPLDFAPVAFPPASSGQPTPPSPDSASLCQPDQLLTQPTGHHSRTSDDFVPRREYESEVPSRPFHLRCPVGSNMEHPVRKAESPRASRGLDLRTDSSGNESVARIHRYGNILPGPSRKVPMQRDDYRMVDPKHGAHVRPVTLGMGDLGQCAYSAPSTVAGQVFVPSGRSPHLRENGRSRNRASLCPSGRSPVVRNL